MDTNVTTPQAVATVIAVEGQAFARDPSGQMRPLKAGDVLLEGDTIVTLAGGQVQLAFLDGHMLSLLPNETFTFSAETAPTTRPGIDEASLPAGEADRIIQALERGENIDDQIEAPGAGLAGGSNNLGNNFVRLLRIVEPLTPLEFQFGNIANRFEFPEIERGANPLLADNVPGVPTVTVPDENGAASGDKTVVESDGPIPGSFTITAPAGLQTLTVGGTPITETALGAATPGSPIVINTGEGTLSITGFNPATGVVSYTYDPNPQNNPGDVTDVVAIQVTDDNGIVSAIDNLDIVIQDTAPLANADAASIAEDATPNTVSGNVRANDVNNVDTPITITAGTGTTAGTYGSLLLNADGSYTYTLDNANPAVNALNNGDTLTEVFSYSVTDADGDVSTTSLTVTINGSTDGVPTVTVPDENGGASGDKTVVESDGPIPGSFTITAPAGLASITVGGTPVTEDALNNLGTTPVTINTGEGTLVLTGFDPATGVVSYTYDPNPQNNPGDVTDVVAIQVTDDNGIVSAIDNLDIVIQDTAPLAKADAAGIAEDATPNTVSGNVRTNDVDNVDSPITITAGTGTTAGTYGSLLLNADGSYTYTLDNANPAVNALNNGDTLTEVFSYSVTDADGDVSTTSLTVTINGSTDGVPTVTVPDENGGASGDKTVVESDGPIPGSFTITAPAGLASITVGGTPVTEDALNNLGTTPVTINTGEGTLVLTGFDPATGVVSYTYDPNPQNNPGDVADVVAIQVTDDNGIVSAIDNLDIVIQDTAPLAKADAAGIAEDATPNTVSGNVRTNDVDNVDSPITITAGTGTSAGTYGSLTLNADGSYTYTLDNANPAVNALNNGDTLTEVFSYSVTDADGDVSTTSLTVTINGSTDGVPTVTVPDENGGASGDKTVVESDGPIPGSFTITAPAGLASITVGGTPVTEDALNNLGTTPVTINTGEGTLVLTGFDPATGVVSYTYDPNPQNNPGDVTDVVAIQVTDDNGIVSAIDNLDIVIQDTAPLAKADAAGIAEDATPNTVSGNVRTNDVDNVDSPITITAGTGTTAGTYGSLLLNADGSYTYTLDNANPAVNALNNGDTLTEVFSYSVTDADGDVSTTSLTVTINGSTDGVPTVTVPDENGGASGDKTVVESDGPIPGSFTITAPAGLASITVGGTPVTEDALNNLGTTPVTINTGEGTLVLTGFDPATGVVSYTYDPNPQNNPGDVTDVVAIQVTDDNGIVSAIDNLDIVIQDTAPLAKADAAGIAEDATPNTVSGNVRTNDVDNVDSPITITAGTGTTAGTYGSLLLNADGSYTYTLDNANPAVNALNNGDTLTEVFSYSVTDADGDVSTTSLTVTINGSTDGVPTVTVPDENGGASGDKTVVESDGPIPGSFTITAPAGLASITVGGTPVTEDALNNLGTTPVTINTGEGTLVLTGFDPATGVVSYTYDPNPQNNPGDVTDVVAIQVTDDNGIVSAIDNLDIVIQDTAPLAKADAAGIAEDATPNTVSGNVRTNDVDNVDSPITITAGTGTSAGTYGSLTLNADGSYTYTLDNANPAVNALNNGDTLTEVFSYSVTDADGDVSTTSLTVTINGSTDGVPTVTVPDENGGASGDKTVVESDGPIPGSFTITAPAGLASITVGGTPVTEDALNNLGTTPVTINTGEGTLVLTGFDPATGVVSYTYDPNPQNNPGDVADVVAIQVTDDNGIVSAIDNLDIVIQDTAPLAKADAAGIAEDATPNTVSGNVRTNDVNNVDTPITITAGTGTTAGTYGSLLLNADGSYTYTLDNANPAVNALNNGDTLTEVFSYSVTDADGDVSTTSLTVTINGSTDGVPTVTVPDENGGASGDKTVVESDGPIPGSFTITAPAGLASITVGGTPVTEDALNNLGTTPVTINTGEGTLVLTGFDPATGVVSYTYDPNPQNNPGDVTDVVAIQVTDDNGIVSAIDNLDIVIQDTAPLAKADAAGIAEDATPNTVSGNVRTNDVDNVDSPITITAGTGTTAGTYGSLLLNADGSYTYTLDNANPAVNALNNGDTLTEVFSYSVTDADGDVSTTSLTVTINGSTDGVPTVTVPDENGGASGDKTVVESDGPIPGSFTITAPAGLASITVGGTPVTEDALNNLGTTPVTINTGEGTLVLTGFDPATGVVSYTYDPNPQNNPGDVADVVAIQVTDDNGIVSAIDNLDIVIQDTAPLAKADAAGIAEDATPNTVSGNVRTNDVDNVDSPITITAGTGTSAGTYGSLTLNADGSYTYTLDNANPAVNALNNGDTLTEVFSYSVTDADGDVSTTSLTVTINGSTDGVPTVTVPDENGGASGDKTVVESDGPIPGSFTITAPAGLASITVGGTPVTEDALNNLGTTPVTINTGEGTLVLTGFDPATGVVSYTYDPNPQNNPGDVADVVAIQVTDDNGIVSAIDNLDIVIQDTAPLANADAASIAEDATPNTVSGNVRANDVDNVDSPITITAGTGTTAGTYGSLLLNADGSYTYTLDNANPAVNALNNGDTLTEVFSYSVTDADGDVSTTSLTVTINGSTDGVPTVTVPDENGGASGDKTVVESDGPIPGSFTITAPAGLASITVGGTPVTEDALNNLGTTPVTINTGEGTLVLTGFDPATGVVSYTYDPNPQNNPGDVADVVAIQVTDDNGIVSAIDNLDIVIQDTAPLANADAASIAEDATPNTVSGNVRANDVNNVDTPITITAGTGTTAGTYGSLLLNADGSYTYTLDNANPAVNALNNGDTLTEVFSYSVTDADGDVSTTSLTVTINGSTDGVPTVTVPDENGGASGDKTVVESDGPIPGSFTITAPAGLASITVGGTPVTEDALNNLGTTPVTINTGEGTLVLTGFDPATGVVSYTYDPNPQNNPGDVADVVAIQVTDDNGIVSAIDNLDIVIQDTAPLANADAASIAEDATPNTVSGNVRANDVNNVDTPITITAGTGTTAGTYGSLLLNADGSYTYTLDNANPAVNALNNGDTLTEVFSYSVTDADGDVSTTSLTVTINGTNDGPVIDLDANNSSGAAGANYTTSFTENGAAVAIADADVSVTDVDSTNLTGATITLTNAQAGDVLAAGALPPGITASIVGNVVTLSGSATLANYQTAIGAITFANSSENPSTVARIVTVVVTDGTSNSNTATSTINVVAVNDPPENTVPGVQSTAEDTSRIFSTANGNAISVADVDNGTLTTTLTATNGVLNALAFAGATISGNGTGTVIISGTAAAINGAMNGLSYLPNGDYSGPAQISVNTTDGAATDVDTINITVTPVADAPTVYAHVASNGMIASGNSLFAANFNSGGVTGWTANALFGNSFAEIPGGNGKTQTETTLFNTIAWAGQTGSNATEQANFASRWATRTNAGESADGSTFAVYNQGGGSGSDDAQGFLQYTGTALTTTEKASTSYVINTQIYADANSAQANGVGFVFGYVDDNNYFLARWENPSPEYAPAGSLFNSYPGQFQELSLVQIVGGVPIDLARAAFAGDDWFTLNISVSNTGIAVTATDNTSSATASLNYTYGTVAGGAAAAPALNNVGFYSFDNDSAVRFDNLTINSGLYSYTLNTEAYLNDNDGSETLSAITLTGIPAGATLMDGATPITVTGGTATVQVGHAITITSATPLSDAQFNGITASVTATESVGGSTAVDSDTVKVDHIAGTSSDDWLVGTAGNNTISGGNGNDVLIGGAGTDTLDGGLGADVLRWRLGETGTDTVNNFGTVAGTDVLDLRDLLVGEQHGNNDAGNLASYLHFTFGGGNTTVSVNADATGGVEQTIVLQGVDLVGGFTSDQQIIQSLLNNNKLIVD